nr:isoform 2 of protein nrt1/ ptr family 5.4 [Quercus suber]
MASESDNLSTLPAANGNVVDDEKFGFRRLKMWLDKAAIVETSSIGLVEQENREKLCPVKQVREVKRLLTLIPMWMAFFAYSLIRANGHTFFFEQRSNMDSQISLTHLFLLESVACFAISKILRWLMKTENQQHRLIKIAAGMVCSILCCIAAWQVEVHRLLLIKKKGIDSSKPSDPDDPNQIIFMSTFWLLPQFILLGLMDALAVEGLQEFVDNHVTKSMKSYGELFSDCVLGFGKFFSIGCILLIRPWFKDDINNSHLDRYFLALAILGLVFFCIYVFCVLPKYAHMEAPSEDLELEDVLEDGVRDLTESKDVLEDGVRDLTEAENVLEDGVRDLTEMEDLLEDGVRDLTESLSSRRNSSSFQWRKVLTVISVACHLYPPLKNGQQHSRLKSE